MHLLSSILSAASSGAWIILPSYMVFVFARDILQGLAIASGDVSSTPVRLAASIKAD